MKINKQKRQEKKEETNSLNSPKGQQLKNHTEEREPDSDNETVIEDDSDSETVVGDEEHEEDKLNKDIEPPYKLKKPKIETEQEEEKKNKLKDIKEKFSDWKRNIFLCTLIYLSMFFTFDFFARNLATPDGWLDVFLAKARRTNERSYIPILIVSFFQGLCFILDSIVTARLKTPLQRVNIKIENALFIDKDIKGELLTNTQEANEHFKETLKKFGILVIPQMLTRYLDNGVQLNDKPSNSYAYLISYFIPIIFATHRIISVSGELDKIEQKLLQKENK